MSQPQHCMRCGGGDVAVIENDTSLCGNCFLDEALRRRRRLSPAPRWRRRQSAATTAATTEYQTAAMR